VTFAGTHKTGIRVRSRLFNTLAAFMLDRSYSDLEWIHDAR